MADDTIKVIDAEPRPAETSQPKLNPNMMLNTTIDGIATLSSRWNPFAVKLGKGLGQFRQFAQEKLGTAEEITELPQEYKDLERRVDALREAHLNLLKVARTYSNPSYDYPSQIQESFKDISTTVASHLQNLTLSPAERSQLEQKVSEPESAQPKTLSHAFSRVAAQGAESIGVEEPLGTALFKFATISEKVGQTRLKMDQEIVTKFNQPVQTSLHTTIDQAMKARARVRSVRLTLDSCKSKHRAAGPDRQDETRLEVEEAEDQFVAAVEEATRLMKAALENPEPFRNLAELVNAQLTYFKEAQEILAPLASELDELQVTQESIYRNSRD